MYTYFSKKEYQKIADTFRLGKVFSLRRFKKGYQTPKVVLTTPRGSFVVSRHRISQRKDIISKSSKSLTYEIDFLNILHGLPVPHHVPVRRRNYILNFKGCAVTVYRFLPGTPPKRITPKMAYALGIFLGRLHAKGKEFHKSLTGRRKFYDLTPEIIKKMYKIALRQQNSNLRSVVEETRRGVEKYRLPRGLPRGPIHVDIKPENELFIQEKLTGVIDFGNFYIGPYMIDFGKMAMWNCIRKGRLDYKLFNEMRRGYESKRKFSRAEVGYIINSILFAIYSHIFVDLYHVPLKYVPESYTLFLVKEFLPAARRLENDNEF